jgi:uncharacterized protein involved in exopolysaccharide biosynthesis
MQQNEKIQHNLSDEIDLLVVIKKIKIFFHNIYKERKKILLWNVIVIIISIVYLVFFVKNYYSSTIEIFPDSRDKTSNISSLAALAGISIPTGGGTNIELFQKIIKSESVLEKLASMKFYVKEKGKKMTLYEFFDLKLDKNYPKAEAERIRFLNFFEIMDKKIQTEIDKQSKVLTLTVTLNSSNLSADVANALINLLDEYIRNQRKSYATNTRIYVQKRLNEVKDSLTYFENLLVNLRERNKIMMAPELLMNEGRIRRQIEILQGVYLELVKQIEVAKIEEIKDIPVVNVKEYAKDPVLKAGPYRTKNLMIIEVVYLLLASFYFGLKQTIKKLILTVKNA